MLVHIRRKVEKMKLYEFMLTLDLEPDLDIADRLYGYFGASGEAPEGVQDVTLATQSGFSIVDCTVEASSFEAALHLVLPKLVEEGLKVVRVEVDESGIALLQEAN